MSWNPFNKKDPSLKPPQGDAGQVLMSDGNGSVIYAQAAMGQTAGQASGGAFSQSQAGYGGAGNGSFGQAGNVSIYSGMTPSNIQQRLASMPISLTKEEQAELETLQKEHNIKVKQAKLNIFKALHADMRQYVINVHEWQTYCNNMNKATIDKDPRLVELNKIDSNGKLLFHAGNSTTYGYYNNDLTAHIHLPLPEGISLEDLKQAHMEASLEEEMLGNEPNR